MDKSFDLTENKFQHPTSLGHVEIKDVNVSGKKQLKRKFGELEEKTDSLKKSIETETKESENRPRKVQKESVLTNSVRFTKAKTPEQASMAIGKLLQGGGKLEKF